VVGGMVTATVLAIFYVPLFFVSIARLFGMDKKKPGGEPPAQEPPVDGVPA
jgi:multidrug efflux pump